MQDFQAKNEPVEVHFWSYYREVSGDSRGIDVDPTKATTIATVKPLATVKKLKSFLGNIRRFMPGLASITLVFTKLLKKGWSFE